MALTPGTRLGVYEVTAQIGAGGMGEVYRATDSNLKRSVAIKVLPASVAADLDRLARFQREAEVLAALNHPNIAAIYGLEKAPDFTALVMELVEGDDLSAHIARGPIPIDEALHIAKQIAAALEAAHEQGIIHRDLKPANVKVRPDGTVKVLDFGLAKAVDQGSGIGEQGSGLANSPTITSPAMTMRGVILGTAAYMSPEQAKGKVVDRRTDLWVFGAVLFEMISGHRPFGGDDVTETIVQVLSKEPDWSAIPATTPASVRRLLRRCLEKDRRHRLDSAADARLDLDETDTTQLEAPVVSRRRRLITLAPWVLSAGLLIAVPSGLLLLAPAEPATPLRIQFDIATPPAGFSPYQLAVSPSGTHVVGLTSENRLWLRPLESADGRVVAGSESALWPFWSPDGRFIAFFSGTKLKRVDLDRALPQTIVDAAYGLGGTWNSDNVIVFAPNATGPLFRVPATGGATTALTTLDEGRQELSHRHPWFLPDGKHFLYTAISSASENSGVFIGSLDGQTPRLLINSELRAAFAPPGHLLFIREGTLMAQPFDPARLQLSGTPFLVAEDVTTNPGNGVQVFGVSGVQAFGVSANGTLAYLMRSSVSLRTLTWFDRSGRATPAVAEQAVYVDPVLSPDGRFIVVGKLGAGLSDLWIVDLQRGGAQTRITFDPASDSVARWSPDGRYVAFSRNTSAGNGLYRKNVTGVEPEELLLRSPLNLYMNDWTPDGQSLMFHERDPETQWDIALLPLRSERKSEKLVRSPFNDVNGRISPDGHRMAYVSDDESGRGEVYVTPFPVATRRIQVSTGGGGAPLWRGDVKELFFRSSDSVMAVDIGVSAGGDLQVGVPRKLFEAPNMLHLNVTRDGRRFLINVGESATSATVSPIRVVLNWNRQAAP